MTEERKSIDRELTKREYRTGQFAEIGSVSEITKGIDGPSRDNSLGTIPVPSNCKWGDANSDLPEDK